MADAFTLRQPGVQTGRMAREPNSVLPHLDTVTRVLHLYRQQALTAMGLPEHSLPQLQPELGLLGSELNMPTIISDGAPSFAGLLTPCHGALLVCRLTATPTSPTAFQWGGRSLMQTSALTLLLPSEISLAARTARHVCERCSCLSTCQLASWHLVHLPAAHQPPTPSAPHPPPDQYLHLSRITQKCSELNCRRLGLASCDCHTLGSVFPKFGLSSRHRYPLQALLRASAAPRSSP